MFDHFAGISRAFLSFSSCAGGLDGDDFVFCSSVACNEFGGAKLGRIDTVRRLVQIAERFADNPGAIVSTAIRETPATVQKLGHQPPADTSIFSLDTA